jgi:ATP-dependent helicase HrpA
MTENSHKENKEKLIWNNKPYEKLPKIGVLDPFGENPNPFTGEEYSSEYKEAATKERHWSKLPFNEPEAQKKTFDILQKNQIILVKSGTGSGKSSQVPKFLIHLLGYKGKIAITIPTQISTFNSAKYMAEAMDVKLGEEIGFKFRGKKMIDQGGKKTNIVFTTDGTILAQLLGNDSELKDLNALVIDEAHKRSSNIDLILLLVKEILPRRPDFKLLIISATINSELFKNYFPSPSFTFAEVEITSNPPFPITHVWADKPMKLDANYYIPEAIDKAINILKNTAVGDILVFLPKVSDLITGCKLLEEKNSNHLSFCVQISGDIFRTFTDEEKEFIIEQQKNTDKRKVILSTAAAEESITIKNIDFVIDSGLNLMNNYDPTKMANELKLEFITKSSAKQRAGRTGRLQPGTSYHLYTEKQFDSFLEYDEPEIKTINLSGIILGIMNMPLVQDFKKTMSFLNNLIEKPSKEAIVSGLGQLRVLGCFEKNNIDDLGKLTVVGKAIADLNMEAGMAKSLLMANHHFVRAEMCFIYSIMEATKGKGISDLYVFTQEKKDKYDKIKIFLDKKGDYFTMLKIYNAFEKQRKKGSWEETKKWCEKHYLRWYPLSQVRNTYFRLINQLMEVVAPGKIPNEELEKELEKQSSGSFKSKEAKLIHSIMDGEGVIRTAELVQDNIYKTYFPPKPSNASLSGDTMLPPKSKLKKKIVYNDLFIGDGLPRLTNITFI